MLEIRTILITLEFDQQIYIKLVQTNAKMLLVEQLTNNNYPYKFLAGERFKLARKSLKSLSCYLKRDGYITNRKHTHWTKEKRSEKELDSVLTQIGELEGYAVNLYNVDNFLSANLKCFNALNVLTKYREVKHVKKYKDKDTSLYSRLNFTAACKGS